LKKNPKYGSKEPRIIARADHNVTRAEFSKSALKVLYRLNKAGYEAFLVGGCVRDAMLELHPKDFDVATNATPEEVKALFGNCRLIGRRFRLAHVRYGREIIEVATFRAAAISEHDDHHSDDEGRILRDNVYGSIDEDVWRRDFTCNALYYNIADFSIWDYTGGFEDVMRKRIVLIGDPEKRMREDPVRMLRAIRFAAKLGFEIDEPVIRSIDHHSHLLTNVPAARLFDEFLKLFQAGNAERTFDLLHDHGLFREMFPATDEELAKDADFMRFTRVKRLAEIRRSEEKMSESQALSLASYEIVAQQQRRISIPKRFTVPMREMLSLQPRFEFKRGKRAMKLLDHRRFRAAYDFMLLLAEVGLGNQETAKFWTDVQLQSAEERAQSFQIGQSPDKKKRRTRRRRRKNPAQNQ
jgi:poly(A) polymerase